MQTTAVKRDRAANPTPAEIESNQKKTRQKRERAGYWRECRDTMERILHLPSPQDVAFGMGGARNDPQWRERMRRAAAWLESLADAIDEMEKPDGPRS